jgi:hypothetical protein
VVLWKLILDALESRSFEYTQALQNYITSFDVRATDGENVSIGLTRFKAALSGLAAHDVPPNALHHFLTGMSKASNKEFRTVCLSQIGLIKSPMYRFYSRDKTVHAQLAEIASSLSDKYLALWSSNQWTGVSHQGSAFRASLTQAKPSTGRKPTYQ